MVRQTVPKSIAQWTGFTVTLIIVLGRDADVLTAAPLGIAAGMLATLFHATMRGQLRPVRLTLPAIDLRRPMAAVARTVDTCRPKRRHAQFKGEHCEDQSA
jgi:hypothetical protein